MTLAVKNVPETSGAGLLDHLAVASLAGVGYVVAALGIVFVAVPGLVRSIAGGTSAVSVAAIILAMAASAAGLGFLGARLYRNVAKPGLCAGVFFGLLALLVVVEVASAAGTILERGGYAAAVGGAVMAAVAVGLLAGLAYLASRPQFEGWLVTVQDQGWFSVASYKRNQGTRVRRATLLGVVLLIGCGIYTLVSHRTLQTTASWTIPIPYTEGWVIPVLPNVGLTLPLLLTGLALWLSWRVVNYPVFADFLIATEAEMNKVSWTSRKRLVQDTIVVLMTVLLLTVFLFVVDMAWAWGLTKIGVLQQADPATQTAVSQEPSY